MCSTRDFTEGFYKSRKELYSSCSILDISDNEKCVHRAFFDLPFWEKCNKSSSCRAPVNILWSMEAVRWMSVGVVAMRWKKSVARLLAVVLTKAAREAVAFSEKEKLQRCPCSAWPSQSRPCLWDLSSWGLWWKALPQQLPQATISEGKRQFKCLLA